MRVRQAFVHAVDRDALVREASEGQYLPANGGFVPPGMPGHSAGIGLVYDVDRARDLLGQAGYPGGRGFPDCELALLRRVSRRARGALPAPGLARGPGAGPAGPEHGLGRVHRPAQPIPPHLSLIGWSADLPDPDGFLRATYHSREGINATPSRWRSARFDALVEKAACAADPARRMALYQEADRILVC